jgi:hypothetical protein
MKKYFVTLVMLSGCFLIANAQAKTKTSGPNKFTSILQLGILEGQADKTYGQLQLVNGIQRNAWFYGLGLGIDYYGPKRSIPLFVDVKRDFKNGKRTPFLYADGGYNFSWLRENDKVNFWGGNANYKQSGGMYYELGIGYKFPLKNKAALGFSAGYSFKEQKETYTNNLFIEPIIPRPNNSLPPDIFDYKFRRISLKFNCQF